MLVSTPAFDPNSPGAQRMAAAWRENRHRWTVRLSGPLLTSDGEHAAGSELELARSMAATLIDDGRAELVSTRIASARE